MAWSTLSASTLTLWTSIASRMSTGEAPTRTKSSVRVLGLVPAFNLTRSSAWSSGPELHSRRSTEDSTSNKKGRRMKSSRPALVRWSRASVS